jgi:hypothetical protein
MKSERSRKRRETEGAARYSRERSPLTCPGSFPYIALMHLWVGETGRMRKRS